MNGLHRACGGKGVKRATASPLAPTSLVEAIPTLYRAVVHTVLQNA